jgi:hypothetical protein
MIGQAQDLVVPLANTTGISHFKLPINPPSLSSVLPNLFTFAWVLLDKYFCMKLNRKLLLANTEMAAAEMVYGMAQYQEMVRASWKGISSPFFVL